MPESEADQRSMSRLFLRVVLIVCVASALLPIAVAVSNRVIRTDLGWTPGFIAKFSGAAIIILAIGVALWKLLARKQDAVDDLCAEQASFLDSLGDRWAGWAILVSAGASLFLELAVIRWQATLFPFFAFYKNFSLLACFAGLGLGYALAHRRRLPLAAAIPLLAWQMIVLTFLRYGMPTWHAGRVLYSTPVLEQLDMGLGKFEQLPYLVPLYLLLSITFLLTALAFVPVGQLCGRVLKLKPKLRAYGLNLLGSILGTLLIFATSYLWTPPPVWFAVALLPLVIFQAFRCGTRFAAVGSTVLALIVLTWPVNPLVQQIHSPYQLIEVNHTRKGFMEICAAGHYFQHVHDLSFDNANRETDKELDSTGRYYELPYRIHPKPGKVAIVGSGAGNDLAAALRMGSGEVHAIEIDPAVLQLGTVGHPEKPYDDKRCKPVVNDARSFFRTTDETFDMVVYGLLDSHALLSHASSVRLDSFVYTVEGIREARECLKKDGTMSLSFCVLAPELGRKIYLMMTEAFDGKPPICVKAGYEGAIVYLQREGGEVTIPPGVLDQAGFQDVTSTYADPKIQTEVSTDDWPFFYMPRRVYPVSYLPMAALIIILTLLLTKLLLSRGTARPTLGHAVFFLLGACFMLVETKAITELGLTFGNTWQVIGIAIIGILVMAFFANAAVARFKFSRTWLPFILLFGSLAGGYAVARSGGFPPTVGGRILTTAVLTCPMFFSGIIFSTLLRTGGDISSIMAANLLGAMVGGLLEYNSMYFGFGFLYLLAIGLYVVAFLCTLRPARETAS